MTNITESTIEEFTIKLLQRSGYEYIYAPDIAHDGDNPQRESYEDVLLHEKLRQALQRINPTIPTETQDEALKELNRIHSPELITSNEKLKFPNSRDIENQSKKIRESSGLYCLICYF